MAVTGSPETSVPQRILAGGAGAYAGIVAPSTVPVVPDHELAYRIGRGAYGEVWLASNLFGTCRAVKIVHRQQFSDAYPFEREFKGLQRYEPISRTHPGLIQILQVGRNEAEGWFYCVMELADNVSSHTKSVERNDRRRPDAYAPHTIRSALRQHERLAPSECLRIGLVLSDALEHLHQQGLVHRDVKPSNIIFVNGAPKLADIGLIAEVDEARSFVGTLGFIPPDGPGTVQADVYGLGKVLYEMFTGNDRQAFPALPEQFLNPDAAAKGNPSGAATERRLVAGLNQIILRACEGSPKRRYPTAQALHDDLSRLRNGGLVRRVPTLERVWAGGKRAAQALSCLVQRQPREDMRSPVLEANKLLEKGHLCALGATPERLRTAWTYFSQALEADPAFIPAHVGLFRVRLLQQTALPNCPDGAVPAVRTAAAKLKAMAAGLGEELVADSYLEFTNGKLDAALSAAERAFQMRTCCSQTRAVGHALHAFYLMTAGRPDEAMREFLLSEREVASCAVGQVFLGYPHLAKGNLDLALAQFQKSIVLEPRQALGHLLKAAIYEEIGEFAQAIEEAQLAEDLLIDHDPALEPSASRLAKTTIEQRYDDVRSALQRGGPRAYWERRLAHALQAAASDPHCVATIYARLGQLEPAYEWLNRACAEGKLKPLWLDLCWDVRDARFAAIARKAGFTLWVPGQGATD